MATQIANLFVSITADSAKFSAQMFKIEKRTNSFRQRALQASKQVGGAFVVATGAATAGLARMVQKQIIATDRMAKLAQGTGTTVEELSSLRLAADLSGTNLEVLAKGMQRFSRVLSDAENGLLTAKRPLQDLGITATDSSGKLRDSTVVMREVADRFAAMEDGSKKTALALELFGRAGANLIPLLNQGADGIAAMQKESDQFGLTISQKVAVQAQAFNDTMRRISAVGEGFINNVMARLLPMLNSLANAFLNDAKQSDVLGQSVNALATIFKTFINTGILVKTTFQALGTQIGAVASALLSAAKLNFKQAFETIKTASSENIDSVKNDFQKMVDVLNEKAAEVQSNSIQTGQQLAAPFDVMSNSVRANIQKNLETLRTSLMGERALLAEDFILKQEQLRQAEELKLIAKDEANLLLQGLTLQHEQKLADIEKQASQQRINQQKQEVQQRQQLVSRFGSGLVSTIGSIEQTLFGKRKAAGIASAIINIAEGVTRALSLPFPANIAAAATTAAAGAAQLASMKSANIGGSSSISRPSGGANVTPIAEQTQPQQQRQTAIINVGNEDGLLPVSSVRNLVGQINDLLDEGVELRVTA